MNASYEKHGGADGLAVEFAKRKAAATSRFKKSQGTSKPQKKRPKIEMPSDRPAKTLASLNSFSGIPIPTDYLKHSTIELKMTFPIRCEHCEAVGTTTDTIMHERLVHNICVQHDEESPIQMCPPPKGVALSIPGTIEPAAELIQLLASCGIEHSPATSSDPMDDCGSNRNSTKFSFKNCTIVIDCQSMYLKSCGDYCIDVWCQAGKGIPTQLVCIRSGEFGEEPKEADGTKFKSLIAALELKETEPKKLMAALFARAMTMDDFLMFSGWEEEEPDETKVPIIHGVWTYLKKSLGQKH